MIARFVTPELRRRLAREPAAVLLGPRQCGKTTLARSLTSLYFDLEQDGDRIALDTRWSALMAEKGLIVMDEAQTWPSLFPRLRGAIDAEPSRRGRFLLLGSVSPALLRDLSESLTGRTALLELTPLLALECPDLAVADLWFRGGLPPVALEPQRFPAWGQDYLRNLAQRDLPLWGWTASPQVTDRFLRMLAAVHGQAWNASQLAASLGLTHPTVNRYLDFLEGAFLVRRLPPWSGNLRKRLRKAPKVYWRDPGLLHALLGVASPDALFSQPWVGASWEGFVLEQILGTLASLGRRVDATWFRTVDGYEIDLVLGWGGQTWAIETKLTSNPSPHDLERLNHAADLIGADRRVLVSQTDRPVLGDSQCSCDLRTLLRLLTG